MKKREHGAAHKSCLSNVVEAFETQKVHLSPPVSVDALAAYESELGLTLPAELVDLLVCADGATGVGGEELLWSLERIRATNHEMRNDGKLQAGCMPFQHLLFFASCPNGNLLGFRVLPFEIDQQVVQWCRKSDNREVLAVCLGSYFERVLATSKAARQTSWVFDAEAVFNRCPVKAVDDIAGKLKQFFDIREGVTEKQIADFEKETGLQLPPEAKAIYLFSDGIQDGWWTVFPLEKLFELNAAQRLRAAHHKNEGFYLPFESMYFFGEEGNGDLYGFPIVDGQIGGRVYRWDHETDNREFVGADLLSFLQYQIEFKEEEAQEDAIEDHCHSSNACEIYEEES